MLYAIVALIIFVASFLFAMLGLGGFIIAPFLMWMGYRTKEAAATTAFVVTVSSFSGYFGHIAGGEIDWKITIPVIIAVIIGSQLGASYMSNKAKPKMGENAVCHSFVGNCY